MRNPVRGNGPHAPLGIDALFRPIFPQRLDLHAPKRQSVANRIRTRLDARANRAFSSSSVGPCAKDEHEKTHRQTGVGTMQTSSILLAHSQPSAAKEEWLAAPDDVAG
ncbi:MAG TPA: hypothetical protein VF193_01910 [Steroidobacter sp.]